MAGRGGTRRYAEIDVAIAGDPRVRRLHRRLEARDWLAAIGAYVLVLAACWEGEERVGIRDAVPEADDELVGWLASVGLIDATDLVRSDAWEAWFGPVRRYREAERERKAIWRAG